MDRRKHNLKQHKILQLKEKILKGNTHKGGKIEAIMGEKKNLETLKLTFGW